MFFPISSGSPVRTRPFSLVFFGDVIEITSEVEMALTALVIEKGHLLC
jgi:hypothetical protein